MFDLCQIFGEDFVAFSEYMNFNGYGCERKANLEDLLNERVAEVDTSDPHDFNQRTMAYCIHE